MKCWKCDSVLKKRIVRYCAACHPSTSPPPSLPTPGAEDEKPMTEECHCGQPGRWRTHNDNGPTCDLHDPALPPSQPLAEDWEAVAKKWLVEWTDRDPNGRAANNLAALIQAAHQRGVDSKCP